jgi:predicted PurR-regulated permease PerM
MGTKQQERALPAPWDRIFPVASRIFVWAIILGILFILRSFFLLLFLTFVFSYVQGHAINRLEGVIRNRAVRVVLVAVVFLGMLIALGSYVGPRFREQAEIFAARSPVYLQAFDRELIKLSRNNPVIERLAPGTKTLGESLNEQGKFSHWSANESPSANLLQKLFGLGEGEEETIDFKAAVDTVRGVGTRVLAAVSAFLLSLLLSFLILLDLPRLARSVQDLARTKLGFIYSEVSGSVYDFAVVLGHSLEAQLFVAIVNTILTSLGMFFLGFGPEVAFLAIIVFACSFVPVAGVFISSIPICLVALQENGVVAMFLAIGLILLIHMIETYILNPRIFGRHLHVNPVLVLAILTVGGKLFGVWGLILGLPVCTYFFGHAIRFHADTHQSLN